MADTEINQLPQAPAIDGEEILVVDRKQSAPDDGTYKLELKTLIQFMGEPMKTLIRQFNETVTLDTATSKPDRAECIAAFKQLPHFDFTKDDRFYIMSTARDKLFLVKYLAEGATDEASAGSFWFKTLEKAV